MRHPYSAIDRDEVKVAVLVDEMRAESHEPGAAADWFWGLAALTVAYTLFWMLH